MTDFTSNLLRYYPLNEGSGTNAGDLGSEGVAGTLTNGPTWGSGGPLGHFVTLDGSNDFILTGAPVTAITNQLCVAAWVNVTAAGSYPMIVGNTTGGGTHGFEFRLDASTGIPAFLFNGSGPGAAASVVSAGWKHVAGVYNGTDIRLYIDGVLSGTPQSRTGNVDVTSLESMTIGSRSGTGGGFPLTGSVRDVRVYSRALTAADVAALAAFVPAVPSFVSGGVESFGADENAAFDQVISFAGSPTPTLTITGGADSGLFSIAGGNTLHLAAKDYEIPVDANADNLYEVFLTATNIYGTAGDSVSVSVSDVVESKPGAAHLLFLTPKIKKSRRRL